MTKKSGQKSKCMKNEMSLLDEIKSIFHHFKRAFIETNKTNFLKGSDFRTLIFQDFPKII